MSLAPLTPKYPIDFADYDAYYDPTTSELHTSASLSQITALPSPGGILSHSPARSRASSRNRLKRKTKSHVNILEPEREDAEPQDDMEVVDYKPQTKLGLKSKSQLQLGRLQTQDPSWLVQTGLSLTESSRETKGQSWISKRDSSTSLANTPMESYFDFKRPRDGRTPRSGRATPARSRVGSRNVSRNASRSRLGDLRMTSTTYSADDLDATPGASFATAPEVDDQIREEDELEDIEPNWADEKTQAEVAAQLQEELAADYGDYDGDPYGMLDFEGQGDGDTSEDEAEVRRAMKRWRVGGWMDGAIDALLMVEEESAEKAQQEVDKKHARIDEEAYDDKEELQEPVPKGWGELSWIGDVLKKNVFL